MKRLLKYKFFIAIPVIVVISLLVISRSTSTGVVELACKNSDYSGVFDISTQQAFYDGRSVEAPLFTRDLAEAKPNKILGLASTSDKWVEVDLSDQKLKAWNGNTLYLETSISSGLPGTPTPPGEYHVWLKLKYTKMEGGVGRYYYNLPNVPYVMFFENDKVPGYRGYGLHGTYWHNNFGTPRSHGCVNLPTEMAKQLYYWTDPVLPSGKSVVYADENNPGTRIVIHE